MSTHAEILAGIAAEVVRKHREIPAGTYVLSQSVPPVKGIVQDEPSPLARHVYVYWPLLNVTTMEFIEDLDRAPTERFPDDGYSGPIEIDQDAELSRIDSSWHYRLPERWQG